MLSLIFIFSLSTNAFAKPSKVNFRVYSCPKKEESGGCPKKEAVLIDKNIEIVFTPLKPNKDGIIDKNESAKHLYVSEKINGLEFDLGARSDDHFFRKGKAEKTAEYGVIVLNVRLSDYKALHYSEHVFFPIKELISLKFL